MKQIEKFLNSGAYIVLIFSITLISWSFYKETPPFDYNLINMIGILFFIFLLCFIFISFRNTMYSIPILIGLLFILNKSDMTFETSIDLGFPIVAISSFLFSFVFHLIRFKPKFHKGRFFLGLFLIAVGYIIALIYLPFDITAIPVSLLGFLYLFFYVFYSSTSKSNLEYLFKIMFVANLVLTFQLFIYVYRGFMTYTDLDFMTRLFLGWLRNLGWANTNDMCFYIALTFPSYIYFIMKKPKNYWLWILMILPVAAVVFTKSRGGLISFGLSGLFSILLFYFKGPKKNYIHWIALAAVPVFILAINFRFFIEWLNILASIEGEGFNAFTSNRIYFYTEGIKIFLRYPIFGGGWLSIQSFPFDGRLFMYHSTIIQALATMGLFGLGALIIHFIQVFKYMFNEVSVEKYLFLIGFIASQLHGLVDNVQYSIPFSVFIVVILAIFETSEKKTSFELVEGRYIYIES
ncbi:MAG: O-antigen ligase family protein [Acholeplasmataceae bacterium]|nr:O-antigen ligase family protein [Acholeplasmataceae bacterium]